MLWLLQYMQGLAPELVLELSDLDNETHEYCTLEIHDYLRYTQSFVYMRFEASELGSFDSFPARHHWHGVPQPETEEYSFLLMRQRPDRGLEIGLKTTPLLQLYSTMTQLIPKQHLTTPPVFHWHVTPDLANLRCTIQWTQPNSMVTQEFAMALLPNLPLYRLIPTRLAHLMDPGSTQINFFVDVVSSGMRQPLGTIERDNPKHAWFWDQRETLFWWCKGRRLASVDYIGDASLITRSLRQFQTTNEWVDMCISVNASVLQLQSQTSSSSQSVFIPTTLTTRPIQHDFEDPPQTFQIAALLSILTRIGAFRHMGLGLRFVSRPTDSAKVLLLQIPFLKGQVCGLVSAGFSSLLRTST